MCLLKKHIKARAKYFLGLTVISLLVSGCNEAFEPKGPFNEQYVVYAVLSTLSDTQYVRLYKTYDPPAFNPLEHAIDNQVSNAQVSIVKDSTLFPFHDTTIARKDLSRYKTDIHAYTAYPFEIERGGTYRLNVGIDSNQIFQGELTVPEEAQMEVAITGVAALRNPSFFRDGFASLVSRLSPHTGGFLVRAYIEYNLRINGSWIPTRKEIPLEVRNIIDCKNYESTYHNWSRRSSIQPERTLFPILSYITVLSGIWDGKTTYDVQMKQVVFELYELNPDLYAYYNIVNGFRDEFSIRADEPDHTNISNGLGIYGALTKQSIAITISETVGYSLSCGNL